MEKTASNQVALARQHDLVVHALPEEVMVYDLRCHKAHCLNKTAAFIWQHCDGETPVQEMAKLLHQETGMPADDEVIWYALDKLDEADLLQSKPIMPTNSDMSRRRMIRRLGGLLVVPTVISIITPTVAQTATTIVTNFKIPTGQCVTQANPVSCDDRCCSGGGSDKKLCTGAGTNWSCNPLFPCDSSGPSRNCTPSSG